MLFFLTSKFIAMSRLETIEGKSNFDVTTILNVSKGRITAESETYNNKIFIQYDCIIDSAYYITVVKVGKMMNINYLNNLYFANEQFPSGDSWFSHPMMSPSPYQLEGFFSPYIVIYNVFLLPLKEIDKIDVFVYGEIIDKEYINGTTVSYFIESPGIAFSFNNRNRSDLVFAYVQIINPIPINIFFTIDVDRNLYIGYAFTKTGTPKTLKEILNNDTDI